MKGFKGFLLKVATLFYPYKVYGKENIPEGKAVICSNHLSMIDALYISSIFDEQLYFLSKKEAFNNKLFGKILSSYGAIPIDRSKTDYKALVSIIKIIRNGNKLVIFPEGTRNKTGSLEFLPFKAGSMVLAVKSKSPIIPIVISRKARIFRKTALIIGPSFELNDYYDKQMNDENIASMEKEVIEVMKKQQGDLLELIEKKPKNHSNKQGLK